jgi:hypothetical protein
MNIIMYRGHAAQAELQRLGVVAERDLQGFISHGAFYGTKLLQSTAKTVLKTEKKYLGPPYGSLRP